jgi:hypothetical protein
MPSPYIAEIQTAHWTSEAVRQSFRDLGFQVREWPLTQHLEKQIPADSIFLSPDFLKLFGLQYKTLYRNGGDFWVLDPQQHTALQAHPWIFYCCSELSDPLDQGIALHAARIYSTQFNFESRLPAGGFNTPGYMRWWAFYQRLKNCRVGARIISPSQLAPLLSPVSGVARLREISQMTEIFLADLKKKELVSERFFHV